MAEAREKARFWWLAQEVQHVFPTPESTLLFLDLHAQYDLGRKRLLDTQLAATLWSAGIRQIVTSNPGDFAILPGLQILSP